MSKYDNVSTCICCGGVNHLSDQDYLDGATLMEATTECNDCGYKNYWTTGHFSREEYDWIEVQEVRKRLGINKTNW